MPNMDSTGVLSLLEQLDDDIDILEDSLAPILKKALSDTASKLPLLDKAKLFVLVTYAIESILFSYLRLNGVKAREHPVFVELTRVKQYFEKIKIAETPVTQRDLVVDQQAARRFIKSGLSGNDRYDLERAEREAKTKAQAHIKFEQLEKKRMAEMVESEPVSVADESSSDSDSDSDAVAVQPAEHAADRIKKRKAENSSSLEGSEAEPRKSKKRSKKKNKGRKSKEAARMAEHGLRAS